jgi:hypothetical protein
MRSKDEKAVLGISIGAVVSQRIIMICSKYYEINDELYFDNKFI